MAALSGLPPQVLKDFLEVHGWTVIDETEHNWLLAEGQTSEPMLIPKHGDVVGPEIMESLAHRTGLSGPLHKAVQKHLSATP